MDEGKGEGIKGEKDEEGSEGAQQEENGGMESYRRIWKAPWVVWQ
jgi:hypothetical protein